MSKEIKASKNGPYVISGTATYVDADGNEQTTPGTAIALCRCGQSGNKPFCNGTHRKVGFESAEVVLKLDE
jgi:CDGSH-type Zn-finger protein